MPDWQERIDDDTRPATRAEHELRYAVAAPLIRASARWCDLGCGTGVAAAAALGAADEPLAADVGHVDRDAEVAARAARAAGLPGATALAADLATPAGLDAVRAALAPAGDAGGPLLVTVFEVIEHLANFAPLVDLLLETARRPEATVLLSVPNDAFWAIENPHHRTTWGEGAVEELRSLLPDDHVALHQYVLQGSAIAPLGETGTATAEVGFAPGVPSHVLLAFGAAADTVTGAARVAQADVEAQRRWERQRESDLLYYQRAVETLERRLAERDATDATAAAAAPDAAAAAAGDDELDAPAAAGHA